MKLPKAKTAQLILSVITFLTCVICGMSLIFAWFASNIATKGQIIDINVVGDYFSGISFSSYAISAIKESNSERYYTLAKDSEGKNIELSAMPTHDPEQIEPRTHEYALLLEINFTVSVDMDVDIYATAAKGLVDSVFNNTKKVFENYLSNCIRFFNVTGITTEPDENDAETLNDIANTGKLSHSFFQGNFPSAQKLSKIFLFSLYAKANVEKTIYFILEYNLDALDYINNPMGNGIEGDEPTEYMSDVSMLIMKSDYE